MSHRTRIAVLAALLGCGPAPASSPPTEAPDRPSPPSRSTSTIQPGPRPPQGHTQGHAQGEFAGLVIPSLPVWTDRYAEDEPPVFLNISGIMTRFGLTRAQAVEAQNHLRDLQREHSDLGFKRALTRAIERARAGRFEPPHRSAELERAAFIVVFDLDDTLYDQYYEAGRRGCSDFVVPEADASTSTGTQGGRPIKTIPGWRSAFDRIRALGGAIVLYSANLDEPTRRNLAHWHYDEHSVLDHPAIAAVLTNSHLVQQRRDEGPGHANPRKGRPVVEPSKDLRILDPSLARVVIIDDNPTRLFQYRNARLVPKFDADAYCSSSSPALRAASEHVLATVVRELEDAHAYSQTHDVSFAQAFLPFSLLAKPTVAALEAAGLSRADAIAWVRRHPDRIPDDF